MLPIDLIHAARERNPDGIAVVTPDQSLSFARLMEQVEALAAGLQGIDPAPGSRVGICAHNTLEHLLGLLAVLAAEKVWVPLNPRDGAGELDAKLDATRPSIMIADEDCLDCFQPPDATLVIGRGAGPRIGAGIAGLIDRNGGRRPQRSARDAEDTQAIKFTGGSSGRPKGVLQPYRAWMTGATCMTHALGLGPDDKYLMAAPLTHGTSCYVTPVLGAGGTLVLGDGALRPPDVLEAFAAHQITTTFLTPTMIYMMLAELGAAERPFPELKRLIYGGAPMPPERIRDAQGVFGPVLATNYGQTEAPQVVTYLGPEEMTDQRNLASVGRPTLLVRLAITDGDGNPAAANEDGEVLIGGDLVMSGYLDMPEATAETLVDGWLRTGDVGMLDERGYLFLKDRLSDVIISGGFNVYPSDVEAALVRHPAVYECVVFGVPDDKWGEAVRVAVQLSPGQAADEDAIIAFAKQELGSVKAPKQVHFYDDLPRSGVGKVLRRVVRERTIQSEDAERGL